MTQNYYLPGIFVAVWSIVIVICVTWGVTYNWPDFLHVNHGLPLIWATHTLNTFVGPVDKWSVDLTALSTDLAIWLAAMLVGIIISIRWSISKGRNP